MKFGESQSVSLSLSFSLCLCMSVCLFTVCSFFHSFPCIDLLPLNMYMNFQIDWIQELPKCCAGFFFLVKQFYVDMLKER